MAAYRSDFLHLWLVGNDSEELDAACDALGDLDHGAMALSAGTVPPPGLATPLEIHHALAGLQFLREHLWEGHVAVAGLAFLTGRVWAIRVGTEASLHQLTGAPSRPRWQESTGGGDVSWAELGAGDVWRVAVETKDGALHAHYRPALASVPELLAEDPDRARWIEPSPPIVGPVPPPVRPQPRPPVRLSTAEKPERSARARARAARPLPALRWPQAIDRRVALAAGAAVLLGAIAAGIAWFRAPLASLVAGSFAVEVVTSPPGAVVRVDGVAQHGKTPMTLELFPGTHQVDVTYGDYARASFEVDGERDQKITRSFAWTGALGIASADTAARLAVSMDGKPLGTVPLWKEGVPVGRHRLAFRGAGYRGWEEEVVVRDGQSARVNAEPVRVPPFGLVTARAEIVTSSGVEDVDGAAVFLDGEPAGRTPVDLKLDAGPHSVRIVGPSGATTIHMLEVQAGGRYFASAQFGRPEDPKVTFVPPTALSLEAPASLDVTLGSSMPLPIRDMRLHWSVDGAGSYAVLPVAIARVEGRSQGTVTFPVAGLHAGQTVRYFVSLETRDGEEYFSEIRTLRVIP